MAFLHIIKAKYPNGVEEVRKLELDAQEIFIGRGSDCQIRLDSEQVDLRHARLHAVAGTLGVEDLGSLSGTWVNEQSIKKSVLQAGDFLRVGDIYFEVLFKNGGWAISEERVYKNSDSNQDVELEQEARSLDIRERLPSLLLLSSILVLAIAFFFFYEPLYTSKKSSWNSGPISQSHAFIASDCGTCHQAPFEQVQNAACLTCHEMQDHGTTKERCASCHLEHNGSHDLILGDSRLCISCHADISKQSIVKPEVKNVHSFDKHPEFSLPKEDQSSIKLNHRIHLQKNLRGPKGNVTLDCGDCHQISSDKKLMREVSFERSCASCHPLSFEERLPELTVPHGKEDEAFRFIYASYSKLYLDEDGKEREELRKRMRPGGELDRQEEIAYIKQAVMEISRKTEKEVFEISSCNLCHQVSQDSLIADEQLEKSKYRIEDPKIPKAWLKKAKFDHSAHDFVGCASCHQGAQKSTETKDVLMPSLDNCRTCHADQREEGKVESDCTLCHSYHDQLELPDVRKMNLY